MSGVAGEDGGLLFGEGHLMVGELSGNRLAAMVAGWLVKRRSSGCAWQGQAETLIALQRVVVLVRPWACVAIV